MAGIGEGEAASTAQHVRMRLEREPGRGAGTLDQLGEARGGEGRATLAVKTNGDGALSRRSLRSARISSPRNGCVAGLPFLTRRTCSVAVAKSTCDHSRDTSSVARSPCRKASSIMVASR